MERKERTFFRHIYIGAVGIISLQKLRESLWGWEEEPGNFSAFNWLERIWVTHQRKWLGFWATRVTESVTQSVCVCENPNAHTSSAHSQSLLINTTNQVRENYAVCEERAKDQEFFSSARFVHFMSWLTDLFVCPTAVRQRPSWAETRNQRSKTNKSVWLAQTKSLNSGLFSNYLVHICSTKVQRYLEQECKASVSLTLIGLHHVFHSLISRKWMWISNDKLIFSPSPFPVFFRQHKNIFTVRSWKKRQSRILALIPSETKPSVAAWLRDEAPLRVLWVNTFSWVIAENTVIVADVWKLFRNDFFFFLHLKCLISIMFYQRHTCSAVNNIIKKKKSSKKIK